MGIRGAGNRSLQHVVVPLDAGQDIDEESEEQQVALRIATGGHERPARIGPQ